MRKAYLYKFTWPRGQWYVGVTVNPSHRRHKHFDDLRKGVHNNRRMQRTFNKYGEPSFSLILYGPEEYIYEMERLYLERTWSDPSKINQIPGGRGGSAKPETDAFESMREAGRKGAMALSPEKRKDNAQKAAETRRRRGASTRRARIPCENCGRLTSLSVKRQHKDCSLYDRMESGRAKVEESKHKREMLKEIYSPDMTNQYFADLLGVSDGTISRWLKEDLGIMKSVGRPDQGITEPKEVVRQRAHQRTKEREAKFITASQLLADGRSKSDVSRSVGISPQLLNHWIKKEWI